MAEWKYLYSEPFQVRHLIAAHHLKDCPRIIEIGGYKTPIADFLTHSFEHVLSVDPLIKPRLEKTVLHAAEDFRYFDFKPFLQKPYALVLLGMDLPFDFKLFYLAAGATKTIVEFPPKHLPSQVQFNTLKKAAKLQVVFQIALDLKGNDFGNLKNSLPPLTRRKLYVLRRRDLPSH